MITSTSSTDRAAHPVPVPTNNPSAARSASNTSDSDQVTTESAALLRAALVRTPEIRPDVVARAREIASDPSYPPLAIVRLIAQQILASPDLSEDQS
jgi:hypothetical protein